MVNRGAFLLRYQPAAVAWINAVDPQPGASPVTIADANDELNVYLVGDDVVGSADALGRWLRRHYRGLFELELEGWYPDRSVWPKDLTFALFSTWFRVERHSVVLDLQGGELRSDD